MESWMYFEGKKVFIILKNRRQYSGVVQKIENAGNGLVFVTLIDKFGKRVVFTTGEISNMEEEGKEE
jgi:hypothetical protein